MLLCRNASSFRRRSWSVTRGFRPWWIGIQSGIQWHGIVGSSISTWHCCLQVTSVLFPATAAWKPTFHISKVAIAEQVWQTNRSHSCNAEAAAAMFWLGPAVLWHEHFVRIWNEMSRISRVYCAACFKNLKETGFERNKTKLLCAPFVMKDCELQLRTFGSSKAASRRCGFRRWPATTRRKKTATTLARWLPAPSNDGSCPPDTKPFSWRCLMITVAYNTSKHI